MSVIALIVLGIFSLESLFSAPQDEDAASMPASDQGNPKVVPTSASLFDTNTPNLEQGFGRSDMVPRPESSEEQPDTTATTAKPKVTTPPLPPVYSEWDLAGVESPLFGTEQLTDFSERSLLLNGKWHVKPHLSVSTFYDDNINIQSQNRQGDNVIRVAPGVTIGLGSAESEFYLVADYTLGLNFFLSNRSQDEVGQNAKVDFRWALARTTLNFHAAVADDYGTSIDATNRVHRFFYDIGLGTHYEVSDKTSFDINTDFSWTDYQGLIGSDQVQVQGFFNYNFSDKTIVGLGGTLGYMNVQDAPNQLFEQANVRVNYRPSEKLSLLAMGGLEVRQFGRGGGESVTPVFSIQASWLIREGTSMTLGVNRQIYASAVLDDQNYTNTTLDWTISQRFTDRANLLFSVGYINSSYDAAATGVTASREDNYFYLRPAVQFHLFSWLDLGVFYEFSENKSSGQGGESFKRSRGGVQAAINF